MSAPIRFIIIDDNDINNMVCTLVIEKVLKNITINTFSDPFKGFDHIVDEYSNPDEDTSTILLLDLKMPGMDGWEFLDRFDELDPRTKRRIKIYILSSSDDKRDLEKAKADKNVVDYFVKPLTSESVLQAIQF